MKLKIFNQNNLPVIAKGKPTIRLSLPSGLVTISPAAGEVLGLTDRSHVELCQNEEAPYDWYIHVIKSPPGFPLRRKAPGSGFCFNCTSIVKRFFGEINFQGSACSFLVSKTPENVSGEKYWYIITKNPINAKISKVGWEQKVYEK